MFLFAAKKGAVEKRLAFVPDQKPSSINVFGMDTRRIGVSEGRLGFVIVGLNHRGLVETHDWSTPYG